MSHRTASYTNWPDDALCQHGFCTLPAFDVSLEPMTGKLLPLCADHLLVANQRRYFLMRQAERRAA